MVDPRLTEIYENVLPVPALAEPTTLFYNERPA
jgi:hypothetical protein